MKTISKIGNYYVGIDAGTESCGWAVTDSDYNLKKFKGKSMWGARLFDPADTAAERRMNRANRRRLARRNRRLEELEKIFAEKIVKEDPSFFIRLHESNLIEKDKTVPSEFTLFNDPAFKDKDFKLTFNNIYFLRSALCHKEINDEIHKKYSNQYCRFVFLVIHHILKNRGHFLFETSDISNSNNIESSFDELKEFLNTKGQTFEPTEQNSFLAVLSSADGVSKKKKDLAEFYGTAEKDEDQFVSVPVLLNLLAGGKCTADKLFQIPELKDDDIPSFSLEDNIDSVYSQLSDIIGEDAELIVYAKKLFDVAKLSEMLGDYQYICDAKIALFKKNHAQLKTLQHWIRKNCRDKYDLIFNDTDVKNNYVCYTGKSEKKICSQEDFCKFLKPFVKEMETSDDPDDIKVYEEIAGGTFFTKLRSIENGAIPYQLQEKELKQILKNAAEYLPFLEEKEDGISNADKILMLLTFRIPFFVGPVNNRSERAWVVRNNTQIKPWNFFEVVDKEKTAEAFMNQLIGRCSYTGDPVLPSNSLIYEEYKALNELNPLKINDVPVSVEIKNKIFENLFKASTARVTKKSISRFLVKNKLMDKDARLSGVDDVLHSSLKTYHDFQTILSKTNDVEMVEEIIRHIVIFGDSKDMLRSWIKNNTHDLDDSDIKRICRLNYKDWGRLSKTLLTGLHYINEDGELFSILDLLRSTNQNFMQIFYNSEYGFEEKAAEYKKAHYAPADTLDDYFKEMYISPRVSKSIRQTVRIVNEIIKTQKCAPKKIFIEMARPDAKTIKKERTESRKEKLLKIYNSHKKEIEPEVYNRLLKETDQSLRKDKRYLYYLQLGKCVYSNEPIDYSNAMSGNKDYDIDHIFPRSKIKDDSLNNRVLVKSVLNRGKTNIYPLNPEMQKKMTGLWMKLNNFGLMSDKKMDRLCRKTPLTEEELSSFVARQLVETQQSTKALASILSIMLPNTKIVYSKAGNVSDFRKNFDIPKCRNLNDLHHAQDAYLNIVVGNVYDTKFTADFFKNIKNEKYSLNKIFDYPVKGAWITENNLSLSIVKDNVFKNNALVTYEPVTKSGALYDLQIMPKGKGQIETKKGRSIADYGGFNKATGAKFFLVESDDKKGKRMRTIEPVYLMYKSQYENNPIHYCTDILHLKNPKILCPSILIRSILEIDGKKLSIRGRSGNSLMFVHTYQFIADEQHLKTIKNLTKLVERKDENISDEAAEKYYSLSKKVNVDMYDWLISRLKAPVYDRIALKNVRKAMEDNRDKFIEFSIYKQACFILEVLKSLRCNAEITNLTDLNGKSKVGIISRSKVIGPQSSISIVHQSVTGLYSHKTRF